MVTTAFTDKDAFISRFGGIYEHSPWVAETVWDSGQAMNDPLALAWEMEHVGAEFSAD